MFEIFFTDEAKEELQSKKAEEVEKIDKRVTELRRGRWKNGTRVKKLRSINKSRTIYEARVDRGRRMLFTLMPNQETGKNGTVIVIFHFSVEHDRVIRTASSILGEEYSMERYEQSDEVKTSFKKLVEEEKTSWEGQRFFHQYLDQLKMYEMDDDVIIRFFNKDETAPEEFWDLKLRLTGEQKEILKKPLPLLLSGTAGSGKTTILIHKILSEPAVRKVYVTYSKELCEEAQKIFSSLVSGIDHEEEYRRNTYFVTFDNLLEPYKKDRIASVLTRDRFFHEYKMYARGRDLERQFPALMIWEEIRGVWKGGAFPTGHYIMTEDEYMALSESEAPNFAGNRKGAYAIFRWYQQMLKDNHIVDEQDLLHIAIEKNTNSYDMVICDEVQDITMLHIDYLFSLAERQAERLILAGDDHQVVHHSGFRWENIKNAFYHKLNKPIKEDPVALTRNFRNTGSIAKFANQINLLQKEYTDFRYKSKNAKYYEYGELPIIYRDVAADQVIDLFANAGPYEAVLVRNMEEQENLAKIFKEKYGHSPLIFTIFQSKGLEFEKVLLWRLFPKDSPEEVEWQKIKRKLDRGTSNPFEKDFLTQRFIRYEASLLYVAVTRAMKVCSIYDGGHYATFWSINDLPEYTRQWNLIPEDSRLHF